MFDELVAPPNKAQTMLVLFNVNAWFSKVLVVTKRIRNSSRDSYMEDGSGQDESKLGATVGLRR